MVLEIERKFILKSASVIDELKADGVGISQGDITQIYTKITPIEEIRFRKISDKFFTTHKFGKALVREETELETDEKTFKKALKNAVSLPIKKTRYEFKINNLDCNIDVYHEFLEGLITFEIEFLTLQDARNFTLPQFLAAHVSAEITDDEQYKNKNLSLFGIPQNSYSVVKAFEILQLNNELNLALPCYLNASDALRTILFQIFLTLIKNLNEFVQSSDTEALHQVRVNLRKTRSLLKIFACVFDEKTLRHFGLNFKNIANSTNTNRDLDVFYEFLRAQKGCERLSNEIKMLTNLAQTEVKNTLQSQKVDEIFKDFEAFLREESDFFVGEKSNEPIKKVVAKAMRVQILKLKKSLLNLSQTTQNARFHESRIEIKRLRYLGEIFGEMFYFTSFEKCFKRAKNLQESFGELQDADVWLGLLKRLDSALYEKQIAKLQGKIYKRIFNLRSEILNKKSKFIKSLGKVSRGLKIYYI